MRRHRIAARILLCAAILALALPYSAIRSSSPAAANAPGAQHADDHAHGNDHDHSEAKREDGHGEHSEGEEGHHEGIAVSQERIEAGGVSLAEAGSGALDQRLTVSGTVIADRNRVGRVAAQVIGTVAELRKRLGDTVEKDEVVAIVDSREVAEAKSEYISALINSNLQQTLFEREKTLYEKQISAEQRYLRAQATDVEAKVRVGVTHQKLAALGVSETEIQSLKERGQSATNLQRYEIRAPIGGRIVEQLADLGTPVGREGEAKELYAIADLSTVWVELALSMSHLPEIREGQSVWVTDSHSSRVLAGKIMFTSPIISEETRTARVIASVDNKDFALRPGSFVSADIAVGSKEVGVKVPKTALQTVKGDTVVFVRTENGFAPRKVTVGSDDGVAVEIVSGITAGETVAASNTFLLKAESGKSEATHSH